MVQVTMNMLTGGSISTAALRQGVMRVLSSLGLNDLRNEWDRLYPLRSGVFHGTADLNEHDIDQLATDIVTFSGRIILALLKRDGIKLPYQDSGSRKS